jgi:hypothetical protein
MEPQDFPSDTKEQPSRDGNWQDVTVLMRNITEPTLSRKSQALGRASRSASILGRFQNARRLGAAGQPIEDWHAIPAGRVPSCGVFSRVLKAPLGGILFLALLLHPSPPASAALPGAYSVTLAWDRSPDSSVTGYRIYYGTASGSYSNNLAVGNVATYTVPGLASGVTYFFAATAYDANGVESPFSNETSYLPGVPRVAIRVATNRQAVLTVKGLIGQKYDILATQTFTNWTLLGSVTLGASGVTNFTDTNAANFTRRFYRTQQKP